MPDIAQTLLLSTKLDPKGLQQLHQGLDDADKKGGLLSGTLGAVGTAVKVVGAASAAGLAVGLAQSITTAADFEKELHAVAASAGVAGDDLERLRQSALKTGKDTALSASESLDAYGELIKAGMSANDVIDGAGRATVDFAVSQGAAVGDMAVLVSNSINTFKDSLSVVGSVADQSVFVADTLAKTANASAIDVGQIKFSLAAVGPVAAQAGLSITDFSTAIGIMGNHALVGSDAGTSLKTMLLSVTAPSNTAAAAMESIGFSAFDANGKVRPFRDMLGELQAKTKDMSDEEKSGLFKNIFGTDAIRAANILVGEGTDGWDKFQETLQLAPGVAAQAAERMKGLSGQIEQLKGSAETLAIQVGTKALPALTALALGATTVVNKLIEGDWKGAGRAILDGLSGPLRTIGDFLGSRDWGKTASVVADGLLAGLRTVRDLGARVGGWLGDQIGAGFVWLAGRDWGQTASVIGDAILAGLNAAADLGLRIGGWLGDQVAAGFAWLAGQDWGQTAGVIGGALLDAFRAATAFVSAHWQEILVYLVTGLPGLVALEIGNAIGWDKVGAAILDGVKQGGTLAVGLAGWITDELAAVPWQTLGQQAGGSGQSLVGGLVASLGDAKQSIGDVVTGWFSGLDAGPAKDLLRDLGHTWEGVLASFTPSQATLDAVHTALSGVGEAAGQLVVAFGPLFVALEPVGRFLRDVLIEQLKIAGALIGGSLLVTLDLAGKALDFLGVNADNAGKVFQLLLNPIQTVLTVLTDVIHFVTDVFSGQWGKAWDDVKQIFTDLWTGISDQASIAVDLVLGIFGHMLSKVGEVFGLIFDAVTGKMQELGTWFDDRAVAFLQMVVSPFTGAYDALTGKDSPIIGVYDAVTGKFHDLWQWLTDRAGDLQTALMAPFVYFGDHAGDAFKGGINAGMSLLHGFLGIIDGFTGGVIDAVNWITRKIGIGDIITGERFRYAALVPDHLATGTSNWRGGYAWVGELGPEYTYLPPGAQVLDAARSRALVQAGALPAPVNAPGFQFGLNPGDILDTLKDAWGAVGGFVKEWIGKGAGALVEHALGLFGADKLSFASPFGGLGTGLFTRIKDGLVAAVKELLGIGGQASSAIIGPSGLGPASEAQVRGWLLQAIAATGVGESWLPGLLWLAGHESGGDPSIVGNDPNDPNHPPVGLLQVKTYHGTMAELLDPVQNATIAIRYILGRYPGGLDEVIQGWSQRGGYGTGGIAGLHGPELAWLGEYGPEVVTPLATGTGGGIGGGGTFSFQDFLQPFYQAGYDILQKYGSNSRIWQDYYTVNVRILQDLMRQVFTDPALAQQMSGAIADIFGDAADNEASDFWRIIADSTLGRITPDQALQLLARNVGRLPAGAATQEGRGVSTAGGLAPPLTPIFKLPAGATPILKIGDGLTPIFKLPAGALADGYDHTGTSYYDKSGFYAFDARSSRYVRLGAGADPNGAYPGMLPHIPVEFTTALSRARERTDELTAAQGVLTEGLRGLLTEGVQPGELALAGFTQEGLQAALTATYMAGEFVTAGHVLGNATNFYQDLIAHPPTVGTSSSTFSGVGTGYSEQNNPYPIFHMTASTPYSAAGDPFSREQLAGLGAIPRTMYARRYALGGILREPLAGIGLLSGQRYLLGEVGPERISPLGGDAAQTPTVIHQYNLSPGAVVIPASELRELQDVTTFFDRIGQTARSGGGR